MNFQEMMHDEPPSYILQGAITNGISLPNAGAISALASLYGGSSVNYFYSRYCVDYDQAKYVYNAHIIGLSKEEKIQLMELIINSFSNKDDNDRSK